MRLCFLVLVLAVAASSALAFSIHDQHPLDFVSKQPKGALAGQVALITGASSGLGKASALILALHGGAKVVVTARRLNKLQELVDEIKSKGGEALAVKLDVLKDEDFKSAFAKAEEHYGEVNHVLANAGSYRGFNWNDDPTESGNDSEFVMKLNFGGVRRAFSYALAAFRKHGKGGSFIATSSGAACLPRGLMAALPFGNFADYAASKAAINHFTRTMAALRKENIRMYSLSAMVYESELVREVLADPYVSDSMGIKTMQEYSGFNMYFKGATGRARDYGYLVQRLMTGGEMPFPPNSNILAEGYVAFSTDKLYQDFEKDAVWNPDFSTGLYTADLEPLEFNEEDRQRRVKLLLQVNDDVENGQITATKDEL